MVFIAFFHIAHSSRYISEKCAFLDWIPLFVFFGLPIVSWALVNGLIQECLWPTFGICFKQLFDTRYLVFCNLSPPSLFLPLDLLSEYRIHLATQFGYSAGEFQALQLIVLVAFGVMDSPLASCILVHLFEIDFQQKQLGCRFEIMDSISCFLYIGICNCIYLDTSYNFSALSLLLKYFSLFHQVLLYQHFHSRSLYAFYCDNHSESAEKGYIRDLDFLYL